MAEDKKNIDGDKLAARIDALSPRRLAILTGAFLVALATLFVFEMNDKAELRVAETQLRLSQAASDGAAALNIAIMTGTPVRESLSGIELGGYTAIFHLSASGDILTAEGRTDMIEIPASSLRALNLDAATSTRLDLPGGKIAVAWRRLDNGDALVVAAPARDMFDRTRVWVLYAVLMGAITLVVGSLMAAFIRQSRAAASAAHALSTLTEFNAALTGGRCSPWFYDHKERTVHLTKSFLQPLGLSARDRKFSLREISALVHPQDLRTALAVISGEPSGVSEGVVRLREPGGGWSRAYFRTSPEATRFHRAGVAFDLVGASTLAPGAAIAETRLRDAIESIPEAFVLWDAQGKLAIWNKRFTSIFRIPAKMLKPGLTIDEVATCAAVAGDILVAHFSPLEDAQQENQEVALPGSRWAHVSRRKTAEGGYVCVASNVTDLKRRAWAQKKKERELQRTVEDLESSRKELSEALRKYEFEKYRAEEASRSKSEFLANMSHELRTPLNAINGFSEVMQSELYGPLGDDKYKEYVTDILSSGRHLLELIDDILDMSKIEAGRLSLEPKRIELERILNESVRLVAKRASDAGVKLTASVAHAPAVWADQRAVKQVVLNLLSNALKFTGRGGEVTLTAEADLDGVTIIVADSGTGIDKEQLRKLGAPFELAESHFSRSRNGSGLGLALSKSLMEMQGGILALASQPGRGTVACATFPRRKEAKVRLPQFIRKEAYVLTGREAEQPQPLQIVATQAAE
ncbi:ATP-binding protein [Hyphococcus formosus]|uniref:sensor histidine kinase n=1 Tax=Hyphococcus formosus TaxID=3143534 RepID=UPI00398BAF89